MKIKKYLVFIALFLTAFVFQNCSDVAFQTADPNNSDFSLEDELGRDIPGLEGDGPAIEDEISRDEEDDYERHVYRSHRDCFKGRRLHREFAKDLNGEDLVLENKRGIKLYSNIDDLIVRNYRGIAKFLNVDDIVEVQNFRGILKAQAEEVELLNNIRGISCIATEEVDLVDNARGIQLIINYDDDDDDDNEAGTVNSGDDDDRGEIGSYRNSRGVLYLENMNVAEVINFRGVILLKNSSIGNTQNVNAVIKNLDSGERNRIRLNRR